MNWKTWVPLVLALALGLVAAKVGRDVLLRNRAAATPDGKTVKVVVAKRDLAPGQVLGELDVGLALVPAEKAPAESFGGVSQVTGRVLVVGMVKEQVLAEKLLAAPGSAGGPAALVPQGMRAVTIEVNEFSGVGGLLVPGCYVDIVSTLSDAKDNHPIAKTIVQNVRVLAVGQKLMSGAKKEGEEGLARSVTMLVAPQQAEAIELACSSGRSRLLMRGLMDSATSSSKGITIAELLGREKSGGASFLASLVGATTRPVATAEQIASMAPVMTIVPAPPPKSATRKRTVEVISGTELSRVELELPKDSHEAVTGTGIESRP
jgi:pilus assembly protein CpaB